MHLKGVADFVISQGLFSECPFWLSEWLLWLSERNSCQA